jgi:hypothetical protein
MKHPSEIKSLGSDFVSEIPSSDSIESATASTGTTFTITTHDGVTSTSLTGTLSISGSQILILLTGGTDGRDYRVTTHATMTTANTTFSKMYEVRVRASVKV